MVKSTSPLVSGVSMMPVGTFWVLAFCASGARPSESIGSAMRKTGLAISSEFQLSNCALESNFASVVLKVWPSSSLLRLTASLCTTKKK